MKTKKFNYQPAKKTIGWSVHFDSLTEIKFALSIMEEYAFMRSPISMYFHPGTLQLAPFPKLFHHRYTPDFLVRNLHTRKAYLIEVKPRAYEGNTQLEQYEIVANQYIRAMKFDWTYKIIYDDQIILTEDQLNDFLQMMHLPDEQARCEWYKQYVAKMSSLPGQMMQYSNAHIDFIMRNWTSHQPNLFTNLQ